jgi:hypothetical protein
VADDIHNLARHLSPTVSSFLISPQMDPTIGLPPGAFEEASVEISIGELDVSVSHANINTYATHVMANILDLHVPHSITS